VPDKERILDPTILARVSNLTMRARNLADGILSGMHKSMHMGVSVEFASHKEYSPGDEIRHLDWKVFGKSDKYYIKRYEDETNRWTLLILDTSGSMDYGSEEANKFDTAATIAATLAYIMLSQGDAVGLLTFSEKEQHFIPPRSAGLHLQTLVTAIAGITPEGHTDIAGSLGRLAERQKGRGMLVLISDLFDDPEAVRSMLRLHQTRKQELAVLHVMHNDEIEFPFHDLTLFKGMERSLEQLAEPDVIAKEYRRLIAEFIDDYSRTLVRQGIDYQLFDTSRPLAESLFEFLSRRTGNGRRASGARNI
jgi:uncharacterized protein (DUF58 family)